MAVGSFIHGLKFNIGGTNTGSCTALKKCICKGATGGDGGGGSTGGDGGGEDGTPSVVIKGALLQEVKTSATVLQENLAGLTTSLAGLTTSLSAVKDSFAALLTKVNGLGQ